MKELMQDQNKANPDQLDIKPIPSDLSKEYNKYSDLTVTDQSHGTISRMRMIEENEEVQRQSIKDYVDWRNKMQKEKSKESHTNPKSKKDKKTNFKKLEVKGTGSNNKLIDNNVDIIDSANKNKNKNKNNKTLNPESTVQLTDINNLHEPESLPLPSQQKLQSNLSNSDSNNSQNSHHIKDEKFMTTSKKLEDNDRME